MIVARLLGAMRDNRAVVALVVTTILYMAGQGAISPVLPIFAANFGVGATLAGLSVGIFGAGRLVMGIPSGYLAERYGRRLVLVGGPAITVVGSVLMAFSQNYPQLLMYRFISGLGGGMQMIGVAIYLSDISTTANRGRYMSLQPLGILTGVSVGPVLGGFAAEIWGLRAPFFIMAALSGAAALWAWWQIPDVKPQSAAPASTPPVGGGQDPPKRESFWAQARVLLLNPSFLVVGLFTMSIFLNRQGGRMSVMPLFAEEKGFSSDEIGLIFLATSLPQFFTVLASGALSDRWGRKSMVLPAAATMTAGLMIFTYGERYGWLILSALFLGIGEGLSGSSPVAFAADIAPRRLLGLAMALYRMFGDLGLILGPVLLGWVADATDFAWALRVDSMLIVGAAVLLMLVARETAGRRRAAPKPDAAASPTPDR